MELSEENRKFIGFRLALHIEDSEKEIKRMKKQGHDMKGAQAQLDRIIELTYTLFIPESWSGPKPWEK